MIGLKFNFGLKFMTIFVCYCNRVLKLASNHHFGNLENVRVFDLGARLGFVQCVLYN